MFDNLSDKLAGTFKKLRGQGKLTERNIEDTLKKCASTSWSGRQLSRGQGLPRGVKSRPGQEYAQPLPASSSSASSTANSPRSWRGDERVEHQGLAPAIIMLTACRLRQDTTAAKIALMSRREEASPFLSRPTFPARGHRAAQGAGGRSGSSL